MASSSGCDRCGSTKAGQRSCCVHGGTWFKNCGNAGDTQYGHTWDEGIQACTTLVGSDSVSPMLRVEIGKGGFTENLSATERHTGDEDVYFADALSRPRMNISGNSVEDATVGVYICALFLILHLQDAKCPTTVVLLT